MALPEEPINREETYLASAAGQEVDLPDYPVNRKEKYLAKIAGETVDLPDYPVTREEQYLAYIAEHGGGGGVTVEALSVTENGTYTAPSDKAYSPVTVNVPIPQPVLDTLNVTENGTYTPESGTDGFDEVVVNVSGGGTSKHGVFFLDYDGGLVEAWAPDTVASKTALPSNPSHTGLVAQGWNWDLQHIKSYIAAYENADVYVGQMYKTASGLTEIDITVTKVTGLTVTCNMVGTKNWGDGTAQDTATSHTYANYGSYTITCNGTSIPTGSSTSGGMFGTSLSNVNRFWCTAIRIGEDVTSIGAYAFYHCYSLTSVTIPQGVTSISERAFNNCYALTSVTIPQGVTSISEYAFSGCRSLTSVTIPQGVTSIGTYAFGSCYALPSVTIPQGVTSIGAYAFYYCYSLTSVTIPQGVTSIGTYAFQNCCSLTSVTIPQGVTSISEYAFTTCYALTSVTIPQGVASIGTYAFQNCFSITEYDFTSAAEVPTLAGTNAFDNINGICKILVPAALYDTWIAATKWSTYANYIYPV